MFNDFFTWFYNTHRDLDAMPALTDADHDEIFRLFDQAGLPNKAMTAEMADGYLTACAVGPALSTGYDVLEGIFGQSTLPICADPQQQEQLLTLLLRRYREISHAVRLRPPHITPDNVFLPLVGDIDAAQHITPYQLDANNNRQGDWKYKEWANGFAHAVGINPLWMLLVENPETSHLITPVILFDLGYNPEHLELQIDADAGLEAQLVTTPYRMHQFWHEYKLSQSDVYQEPYQREAPKIGRNDPCPCGSGKKYKKCCGA
jgi:uncharacterized protein